MRTYFKAFLAPLALLLAVLFLPITAMATPLSPNANDGNANYGCQWVKAENGNYLVLSKDCNGVPMITGGYKTVDVTYEVDLGCETATVTERQVRESRGGRVESSQVTDVSFE